MSWLFLAVVAAVLMGPVSLKRLSWVSAAKARQLLREGALVVDVRSPAEFASAHLPGAVNLPFGDLNADAVRCIPDKSRVLLLHCLGGTRSGSALHQLKEMGYTSVFNLGSYNRAEGIVRPNH